LSVENLKMTSEFSEASRGGWNKRGGGAKFAKLGAIFILRKGVLRLFLTTHPPT
jgi:hypothetical protein